MSQSFDKLTALARFQEHLDAAVEAVEAKHKAEYSGPADSWKTLIPDEQIPEPA
jgi:hypothetical protein